MRSVDDLAFTSEKASLMSGLGYSLSVDLGDSSDPDLDEQFHSLSRHRSKRPKPVATTRLVFAEVEPSRLVPVPKRSTTNASRSEGESIEDKITANPEQTEGQCVKQSAKRNKRKSKKALKTSTSTPDPSTLETTPVEVEEFVSDARSLSDLQGPRRTSDEDVWKLCGEKLANVCQKMFQMFPENKMQTVSLKNLPIRETFDDREIVEGSVEDLNGSVRVMQSKAVKSVDMQAKPEAKEDKEEMVRKKFKVKNARLLPTEGDNIKNEDELLVNQRKLKTALKLPLNGESNETTAVDAADLQLSKSDEHGRKRPKKSSSLSHPLNSEIKQQEPISDSDVASHRRVRKGSSKTRNKRKNRSKSMSEFSQETTVYATQDNQTEAKNNDRKGEQYDENYNITTVCEESVEGGTTKQRSKQEKRGNRQSLELATRGKQTQKKTKASKKAQNEAEESGRVEYKTIIPVEHEANRTFEENEAIFAIRTFAEIEARTSEQVEHESSTSKIETKASNSKKISRKAKASIENETGLSGQTENHEVVHVVHETKARKKIPKTSGKVNRLSKREQNITITGSEFSLLYENALPDSIKCEKSSSSQLTANANGSVDIDVSAVKEITDDNVTSTDIDYVCRVNLKPVVKKKRKKQKTGSKVEVVLKTDAVESEKREDLRVREDLSNNEDLEHYEDFRDSKQLKNSENSEDSEGLSEEETIVQMDCEPRSGVRRPGGTIETLIGVSERDWEKSEENLANTSGKENKANTSGQVENKVENETRDATEGNNFSKTEEEFEEQILVMDREPRGGTARLNRNIEPLSVVEVTDGKRSAGVVNDSLNVTSSQCSLRQNSRSSANPDQNAKQRIKKSKDSSNEDSPEIRRENVQIQEVNNRNSGAGNGQKSLCRNDLNVLKAEVSAEHRTAESSNESRNPVKPDLNNIPANNKNMETTPVKEDYKDMDASKKPVRDLIKTESHTEDTRRKKKSSWRDSEKAVESIRSDECSREFLRSANSSGHLWTVSNEREIMTPNAQQEMKESSRPSLNASLHLNIESTDPKVRAMHSENEIKTPNPLESSADLNTIAKNTEFGAQSSENNVRASSSYTVDAVQYRLPQLTSAVLNNTRDQEKTENDMTNEQTLILKALAERIRCGQVEIIIVNKLTVEEQKIHHASGSRTQPLSANLTNLLNAGDASEKVDASRPPMLMTDEGESQSAKYNEIKFIDSDDSADILETSGQVSKLADDLRTVSNEKRTNLSVTKADLPENRTHLPGLTVGISGTKLDLPATNAHFSETRIDIPVTKMDLPESKVDLSETKVDLPETKVDLPETKVDLPEINLDLPGTKVNVVTNQQKSQMQNGQHSETLVGVQDTLLPASPVICRAIASNKTSESQSTSTTIPCVNKTLENTTKVNTLVTRTQSSGKTELENNQEETFIKALPQSISNPAEIRKRNSVEVGIVKPEPPKPKPRNSISDYKSEIVQQNSTKPSAFASTTLQKLTDPNAKLNTEGLVKMPTWHIKPTPRTNLPTQNKPASSESNDAKEFEGESRPAMQIQPQPIPRTKLSTITNRSQAQLSNHLAPNPPVSEDKSSPNQQESSESSDDLPPYPTKEVNAKKTFPVREMQANLDETASPKGPPLTQVTTTSGNDSSISSLTTAIPVENSSKTTEVTIDPIEKSSAATQIISVPSKATQTAPVSEKNSFISLSTSTLPSSLTSNTTPNIALNYRPIIGTAKSISPVLTNIDRNTFAPGYRYAPFTRYTSSPSWWNVYQRKLDPDYARQTGLLRHQITKRQDGHTEPSERGRQSQHINTTARTWASNSSGQLCNSTVNTEVDFSEGTRDVTNDQKSLQQNQHSKQQENSEQTESGQNAVGVKPETSTLMSRQSLLPSTNGHLVEESNRAGKPVAETNDAGLRWEQRNSSISAHTVKDLDSNVLTGTEEAVVEGSGFEARNYNEKETAQYKSSTERNKEEYVSTVVTHEYGEVIVLHPAT